LTPAVTRERAERIARGHACDVCGEYSYKKLRVAPAPKSLRDELHVTWVAKRTCGVCGAEQELGINGEGDVVFVT
jgi:hypothetical protein